MSTAVMIMTPLPTAKSPKPEKKRIAQTRRKSKPVMTSTPPPTQNVWPGPLALVATDCDCSKLQVMTRVPPSTATQPPARAKESKSAETVKVLAVMRQFPATTRMSPPMLICLFGGGKWGN